MSELSDMMATLAAKAAGTYAFPIPNATFSPASVPRETLNDAAPNVSAQQLQTAAAGSVIGFGYGRCRIGFGILFPIVDPSGNMLIPGFLAKGPIDAIEEVELDNAGLLPGIFHVDYTGAPAQPIDPSLRAAWLAKGQVYADAMPGIAYDVVGIPNDPAFRFGNLTATVRLLLVYDPRDPAQSLADETTWRWTQNPVLALAHFLSTPGFGPEELMDWTSVALCADIADQVLTTGGVTQARRQIGIFFNQQQAADAIEETLRSYAGVFLVREDDVVRMIPDALSDIVYTFTNGSSLTGADASLLLEEGGYLLFEGSSGHLWFDPATAVTIPANYILDSLTIASPSRANSPTVVTVKWTDTTQSPWGTQEVTVSDAGVDDGSVPWIESVIDWPGCQSAGMAYREAVRRLNEFNLADTSISLVGTDEALRIRRGDVVGVTDSDGFTNKPYRVTDVFQTEPGRWQVSGTEYQPGLYSDTVYTGPVIPDSGFPLPTDPPIVTGLALVEEPYLQQYKVVATQVRLTWDRPAWPFLDSYHVVATIDGIKQWEQIVLVAGGATDSVVSPALRPGEQYDFAVAVRSTTFTGPAAHILYRVIGKSAPPSDVASIGGFSVGGETFLSWREAVDDDQIHIRYELRYGSPMGAWETATSIQKIAALHYAVPGTPLGTWRFLVKAIDSIGQESANAAYIDLTVTDTGPFAVTEIDLIAPTVAEMSRNDVATQAQPRWVSDVGDPMSHGHVDTNDATGGFIDANIPVGASFAGPISTTAGGSAWISETYDAGMLLNANWAAELPYRELIGTVVFTLFLSTDNVTWTPFVGGVALTVGARYAYIEARSVNAGDAFAVDGYGSLQIVQIGAGALRPGAVTAEAVASDTTVTVVIDGVTLKLLAKA